MGSDVDFRAAVYGQPHPGSLNLIKQTNEALSSSFTNAQSSFLTKVKQLSEDFSGNHVLSKMKSALNKLAQAFLPDIIQYYDDIDKIQQAASKMRYLIMSEPTLLKKYRNQEIAGYDEHFTDIFPDQVGIDHPVYQAVNNGILVEGDEETPDTVQMFFTDDDNTITVEEQVDIKYTQALALEEVLYGKRDPTSPCDQQF